VGPDPREDVRLFWKLPAGTEILEAFPPVGTDGSVSFGSMTSGQSSSSRLVVRLLTPQNVATFSFRVQDRETVVNGIASRRIIGSGLVLEPLIPLGSVVQEAVILYRLANETNLPIDDVRIGADPVGRLEPFEERVIPFFPTTQGPVQARASVKGVTVVDRLESYALLSSDPTGVRLSLNPSVGSELSFRVSANRPASVAVWHPGLSDAHHLRVLDVPAGETDIRLPVQPVSGVSEWYVIRFQKRPDGNALGTFASAPISTPFTIHTTGRYYAVSGDQIGIGPLPPQVGEMTKLWIGLRLGPTTADLSNVRVRIKLAPGVLVTGRDALVDGGSFTETDTELIWNLGYMPTDSDGAGASFEIQLTPNKSQKGSVPVLVESVVAEAVDVRADLPRIATDGFVDMNLPEDEVGKGRGVVQ
jgi:hypothetical protein